MELSKEILARITRLGGGDLPFLQEMLESRGEEFVLHFLDRLEASAEEYRLWFPRLQAFAADCRRASPIPDVETFTAAEREQYRLLLAKMKEFVGSEDSRIVLRRQPNKASILSASRAGLPAVEEVFGGAGAIILADSEKERWFSEIYTPKDEDGFRWHVSAWWRVKEGLSEDDRWAMGDNPPLDGYIYWVVDAGLIWGPLYGGGTRDIYRWDGQRAERVLESSYDF